MNETPEQRRTEKAWKPSKSPIWWLKENENAAFQLRAHEALAYLSDLKVAKRSPRYPSELNLVEIKLNAFVTGVEAVINAPKRAPKQRPELTLLIDDAVLTIQSLPLTHGFSLSELVRDTPENGTT